METTDTPINEKESLRIIEQMIHKVKSDVRDESFMYLLWGWLVLAAAAINYILQFVVMFDKPWLPWPVLMGMGGIVSMIYGARESKREKVKTYVSQFLGYLVIAFLVGLFTVLGFMWKLKLNCYPMILVMYGIWLFVSGGALQFRPLVIGGIINWGFAIASFFVVFQYQLIMLGVAVLLGYIIPGHMLRSQFSARGGSASGGKKSV
jgi:hypothetical protein